MRKTKADYKSSYRMLPDYKSDRADSRSFFACYLAQQLPSHFRGGVGVG